MRDPFNNTRLRELVLFDRLVVLGTITAVAKEQGIPKPTASRWLALLEENVGVPLLIRGARRVRLTESGRVFHAQLRPLLRGLRAAQASILSDQPSGTLRVSVPVPLGRLVGGAVIARFAKQLPGVRLEILLQNTHADFQSDQIDLAIRAGPLPDSSLVARALITVPIWLYGSVAHRRTRASEVPLIAAPGDERLLRTKRPDLLPASVVVDDRTAVRDALQMGAGVGVLPAFLGEPLRAEGVLYRLREQALTSMRVSAVYQANQRQDSRLRVLIDLIEAEIGRWALP